MTPVTPIADPPTVPAPNSLGLTNLGLDDSRSVRVLVGPDGGVVSTTAIDGTAYTLTIPAGVLPVDTEIGMYPITHINGLEASNLVGVHMTPEGLNFDRPATLTVALANGQDATGLFGLTYAANLEGLHRYPVTAGNGTLTFQIPHFSGFAGSDGLPETADFPTNAEGTALNVLVGALFELSLISSPSPETLEVTAQEIADSLRSWYAGSVRPRLDAIRFQNDPDEARLALNEFSTWRYYASGSVFAASIAARVAQLLQAESQEANSLAGAGVRVQFDFENLDALQNGDLASIIRALDWYARARSLNLDTAANRLDQQTIASDIALEVVFENVEFPADIDALASGTLRVLVGYRVGNGSTQFDQVMDVLVGAENGNADPDSGVADPQGLFTTTVERLTDSDLIIEITAAFANPPLDLVSGNAVVVRGAVAPSPSPSPSNSPTPTPSPSPTVADLNGTWTGTGEYVAPGFSLTRNYTLVIRPAPPNMTGEFTIQGRETLLLSGTVGSNPASFSAAVRTNLNVPAGQLGGSLSQLNPAQPIVLTGTWANFDAGGTEFRFTGTRTGP
jgi:hypothetical protein